jgi:hypothetical protein
MRNLRSWILFSSCPKPKAAAEAARAVALILATCAFGTATPQAFADGVQQYKFENNTGVHANDLHIVFSVTGVSFRPDPLHPADATLSSPSGTFTSGNGSGTATIDLAQGFTGSGVNSGASVILSFNYAGSPAPRVKSAYWTTNNTTDGSGKVGQDMKPDKTVSNYWAAATATGNGRLLVTIDGVQSEFDTTSGDSASATATKFATFLNGFPLASVIGQSAGSILYAANVYGTGTNSITVTILAQDSTQSVTVTDIPWSETIPTLSQWGLITLALMLVAAGIVSIRRHQTARLTG